MPLAEFDDVTIHYLDEGMADGPPVVFSHSIGVSLALWDKLAPLLADRFRVVRMDNRGHGASSVPPAPYTMGRLTHDLERLIEHLALDRPVVVGLSIGGQMAQALAAKRPEMLRGAVLCATGLKIATPQMWNDRAETVRAGGMEALADAAVARWFAPGFSGSDEARGWRDRLAACPPEGYIGACAALAGADLISTSSVLHLPVLALAAADDLATPPDLVREMADIIPHAEFRIIRNAGHLFPVEQPQAAADAMIPFLDRVFI